MLSVDRCDTYVLLLDEHSYAYMEPYHSEQGLREWLRVVTDINKATVRSKVEWKPWIKYGTLVPVEVSRVVAIIPD